MNDLLHAFPGQQVDEPTYVFARPYPIAFLPTAAVFLFIVAVTALGEYAMVNGAFAFESSIINVAVAALGLFQMFTLVVFCVALFDFYFDVWIVTNRRVVDISQEQLFFRRIDELSLQDVEDVSSQQKGFLQTLFNYGQVELQSAGTKANFIMDNVYMPREIAAIVLDLAEQAKSGKSAGERVSTTGHIGMINNKTVASVNELCELGAAHKNAAPTV